jgi:hypothetical protein
MTAADADPDNDVVADASDAATHITMHASPAKDP